MNDLAIPVQIFTDGTEDFFPDSLSLVISEVGGLFHQWACVQHKGKPQAPIVATTCTIDLLHVLTDCFLGLEERDNHRNVRKKITKYLSRGLGKLSFVILMAY